MILETPEQLEALHEKYPIAGPIALGKDSFTVWSYDGQRKNQLVVMVRKGEKIQYEEKPVRSSNESRI